MKLWRIKGIIISFTLSAVILMLVSCTDQNEDLMLSSLPDREIYLYSANERDLTGVILAVGDSQYSYDWYKGESTTMQVNDYDADGDDELSVIAYIGGGTGVSLHKLYMVELSEEQRRSEQESDQSKSDPLEAYHFDSSDYVAQLEQAVDFKILHNDGLYGELTVGSETHLVDLTQYETVSERYGKLYENIVWGGIANFEWIDDQLTAIFGVGLDYEKPIPIYIGKLYADVSYADGEFTLVNLRFEEHENN